MKKVLIITYLFINLFAAACNNSNSGKKDAPAVPESVLASFNAKYPDAKDVKWEQEVKSDKIIYDGEFKVNDKKMVVKYDDAGNFIEEK
jgi:hypothetical protein